MVYIVVCADSGSELPTEIAEAAASIYRLGPGPVWFIDIDCSSSELVDMIWPDEAEAESPAGTGVIVGVDEYTGYAPDKFWKWIKARVK